MTAALATAAALACEVHTHTGGDVLAHVEGDGCGAAAAAAGGAGSGPAVRPPTGDADSHTEAGLFHYGMKGPFYSADAFPAFKNLQEHWVEIQQEATAITAVLNLNRKQDEWSEAGSNFVERIVEAENRGWTVAWDGEGKWLNYALAYYGNIVPGVTEQWAPKTVELLRTIPGIRVGGFSRLLPEAYIAPHVDSTGPQFNSMAFHLCLTGHASLRVGEHWVEQSPGKILIFDSTYNHEVKNGPEDRIILYLDFDINEFMRGTEGIELTNAAAEAEASD